MDDFLGSICWLGTVVIAIAVLVWSVGSLGGLLWAAKKDVDNKGDSTSALVFVVILGFILWLVCISL